MPEDKDQFSVPLSGWSMYPSLYSGDKLTISKNTNLNPGSIILFRDSDSGEYIAHRIVAEGMLVKGDRSLYLDNILEPSIVGQVIGYNRKGKMVFWFAGDQPFARQIAFCSLHSLKERRLIERYLFQGILFFLVFYSYLFCDTSKECRI